jgi:hypothetical protein
MRNLILMMTLLGALYVLWGMGSSTVTEHTG